MKCRGSLFENDATRSDCASAVISMDGENDLHFVRNDHGLIISLTTIV